MKFLRSLWLVVPAVLLVVVLTALFITRSAMEELAFLRRGHGGDQGLVDQRPVQTAATLAALAVSSEEQSFAQEAERLSDHEVDQAFAQALRQASMQHATLTGEAATTSARVTELKSLIKDDTAKIATLTPQDTAPAEGDDLDIAKAQLGLDQDELTDASADLARQSGDQRARIQQELNAREAAAKKAASAAPSKDNAVAAAKKYASLRGRITAWFDQRNRANLLAQARAEALGSAKELDTQHDIQEARGNAQAAAQAAAAGASRVQLLQTLATRRVIMSILDDRVQTQTQLANVYGRWETQVWLQHRIVTHLVLQSVAWLAFIALLAAAIIFTGHALIPRLHQDSRRTSTLDTILTLVVEVVAALAALAVIFGVPDQMPTILGLATAGLTVVFQDFILAFFGWFVLMGKNGMRPCDWVEIDGVGGEVLEIGLFRTALLETGNWTSRGHPTGRRVSFTNSFAIRGQYFNFSTHGQWMWDEIKLNLPAAADAWDLVHKIQAAVEEKTAKDTDEAEAEWRSATGRNGLSQFSAKPTVDLRPAASGVDVLVRFVTRANQRFDLRNQIYESLLALTGASQPQLPPASSESQPA